MSATSDSSLRSLLVLVAAAALVSGCSTCGDARESVPSAVESAADEAGGPVEASTEPATESDESPSPELPTTHSRSAAEAVALALETRDDWMVDSWQPALLAAIVGREVNLSELAAFLPQVGSELAESDDPTARALAALVGLNGALPEGGINEIEQPNDRLTLSGAYCIDEVSGMSRDELYRSNLRVGGYPALHAAFGELFGRRAGCPTSIPQSELCTGLRRVVDANRNNVDLFAEGMAFSNEFQCEALPARYYDDLLALQRDDGTWRLSGAERYTWHTTLMAIWALESRPVVPEAHGP